MVQCFIPWCKNRSDSQNWKKNINRSNKVKVTFHSFPKDPSLWLDVLGMESSSISKSARICSIHFEEESFDRRGCHVRLRPNALPRKTGIAKDLSSSANEKELVVNDINLGKLSPNTVQYSTSKEDKETMTSLDDISNSFDECPLSSQPSTSKVDKGTMVSPLLIYNSPEMVRLRQRIEFLEANSRKKIRLMQQKLRQKVDQVLTLKGKLKDKLK